MKKMKVLTSFQADMVTGGSGICTCYFANGKFERMGTRLNKDICLTDCCSKPDANRVIFQSGFTSGWELGRCASLKKPSFLEEKKLPFRRYSNLH